MKSIIIDKIKGMDAEQIMQLIILADKEFNKDEKKQWENRIEELIYDMDLIDELDLNYNLIHNKIIPNEGYQKIMAFSYLEIKNKKERDGDLLNE